MNAIADRFIDQAKISGKIPFFPPDVAMLVIAECKKNQIPIYGIDAVKITDTFTQPFMEYSIDYSAVNNEDIWDTATQFILSKKHLGLHFEIVIPCQTLDVPHD